MNAKQHVLFVDDEPLILQGLGRALRHLQPQWQMHFAEGGVMALDLMAHVHFDVVVTDMRMPGMSGAELLDEVVKRHPDTIRIILSGQADQNLLHRCIGTAHQFLAKPCAARDLEAALSNASSMREVLGSDQLLRLVSRMERIPSVPAIYATIVKMLQDPDAAMESVGTAVAQDLGTTAGVLKIVNSAFFGLRRNIADPSEAVRYLGMDMVKALVLAVGAFAQFREIEIEGFSVSSVWHHSMVVGSAARTLARLEHAESRVADECFTAGLLHDAGKLILADNCPDEFAQAVRLAREQGIPWHVAERQVFGADHAEVAGCLFGLWGLPSAVVEAIMLHHSPGRSPVRAFSPLVAVHAADVILHGQSGIESTVPPPELDRRYLEAAGLLPRLDAWRDALACPVATT